MLLLTNFMGKGTVSKPTLTVCEGAWCRVHIVSFNVVLLAKEEVLESKCKLGVKFLRDLELSSTGKTIHFPINDHVVMEDLKVVGNCQEEDDNANSPRVGCVQWEEILVQWWCCRADHSAMSCPSRRLDHPIWSWACAAAWVESLVNGENREDCSMQRPWSRQNWISDIVSTDVIHCSKISSWEWCARCIWGSGQMRTCLVISGSWLQQGQQALSHLPQRHIIHPVEECPETSLEYHSW